MSNDIRPLPEQTGWQIAVRLTLSCAITAIVPLGAFFSIRYLTNR